jgi:hypothetical protein
MNDKLQQILESLIPFIVLGIAIALFIGLLFMFSYVVVWGLLIGGALWLITVVKEYVSPSEHSKKEKGRVIEHDDKK